MPHRAQGGSAELAQSFVAEAFDRGEAFEDALQEARVLRRARRQPRGERRIGDREALAGRGQRVVVQTGRGFRIRLGGERGEFLR